jgi:hypothetical protein
MWCCLRFCQSDVLSLLPVGCRCFVLSFCFLFLLRSSESVSLSSSSCLLVCFGGGRRALPPPTPPLLPLSPAISHPSFFLSS